MMELFKPIAWVFGYVLRFINGTIGFDNYLLTIFWFTLLIRLITFPFSLKNQKSMCDRARLAPKLERLQKKYARDQKKLQEKTQELYQKENVSMTGGCGPMPASENCSTQGQSDRNFCTGDGGGGRRFVYP